MSKRSRRRASPGAAGLPVDTTATPPTPANPDRLLLDAIADGELDHSLNALADAVHARLHLLHTVQAANARAQLCIGNEVRINHTVKPRTCTASAAASSTSRATTSPSACTARSAVSPAATSAALHSRWTA